MFELLIQFLDKIIDINRPLKTVLMSFIMASLICISVIIIGIVIEKFEQIEIKLLMKITPPKKALFIEDRLTFPGTILHEFSHAFIAWITGAKILKIRFLTFFDAHKLGYVYFQPRGNRIQQYVQLSLTNCAPVLIGMAILKLIIYINMTVTTMPLYIRIIIIYLFVSVLNHMTMSITDIKNYLRGLIVVFPIIFLLCYAALIL